MPIFEYRCSSCGQLTEKIQRQPQKHVACPECGGIAARAISRPSATSTSQNSCSRSGASGFT